MADNRNIIVTMTLRDQLTGKAKQIEGSISSVKRQLNDMSGTTKKADKSFNELTGTILKSAPAFAVATAAITAVYQALRLIRDEFIGGLKAVEEYKLSVASMAGFVTQFSKKYQEGNPAKAFEEAVPYVQELVTQIEVLDAQTVANSQHLTLMAETLIKNRVKLDLSNEKTKEGFVRLANAVVLLTGKQNKMKQIEQEIMGIYEGRLVVGNRVLKFLNDQNPLFREQLAIFRAQGRSVEYIGEQLAGFGQAVSLIETTWEAVGSTMETIHKKILREGFKPVYSDLLNLAMEFNQTLFENGELTQTSLVIVKKIRESWEGVKISIRIIKAELDILTKPAREIRAIFGKWFESLGLNGGVLDYMNNIASTLTYIKIRVDNVRGSFDLLKTDVFKFAKVISEALEMNFIEGLKHINEGLFGGGEDAAESFIGGMKKQIEIGKLELANALGPDIIGKGGANVPEMGTFIDPEEIEKIKNIDNALTEFFKDLYNPLYDNAITAAMKDLDDYEERFRKFMKADFLHRQMAKTQDFIVTFSETVQGRLENAFSQSFDHILQWSGGFGDNLKSIFHDMVNSILSELMRVLVFQKAAGWITKTLLPLPASDLSGTLIGAASSAFGPGFAQGGIFGRGISGYSNQIINKPTIFPFARGMGLMGEAGPEAIMPLKRGPSGKLGVEASGANNIEVNVNIDARNAEEGVDMKIRRLIPQIVSASTSGTLEAIRRCGYAREVVRG